MQAQSISTEILRQLGGRKFLAMTGAKNLLYAGITEHNDKVWLRMDIPRNSGKVNRLKISYNHGSDDYTMEFYKQTMSRKTFDIKITNQKTFEGVYCDQLQSIFTEVTGMYTRL